MFNGNTIAVVQPFVSNGCQPTAFTLNANIGNDNCSPQDFCYASIPAPNIGTAYLIPIQMQFVFNGD